MADKVVAVRFEVNSSDAVEDINKVKKVTDQATESTAGFEEQLKETKKASDAVNDALKQFEEQVKDNTKATTTAAKATKSFDDQLSDIKSSIDGAGFKDLNKAVKQYRDIALQAGETTPIGRQALAEAGELKDRLGDLRTAIQTTGADGKQLQAALQLGGGIVAGFGAVQGVMALVGSESEDLQKTLVKLQAAQAALVSIEEIRSVLEKESALRIVATTIAEKARAAATALGTMATNAGIMSLRAFKIALAATGIGAIVFALGLAAEAMGFFGDSTDDAAKSADKLNKELDKQKNLTDDLNKSIDRYTEVSVLKAKIAGATEEDITKMEIDAQNERIQNLKAYQDQAFNTYTKIANSEKEAKEKARQASLEADKAFDDAVAKRNIMQLERDLKVEEKRREAEKQASEEAKKRREEEAANLKKFREERQALDRKIAEEAAEDRAKLQVADKDAEIKAFMDKQFALNELKLKASEEDELLNERRKKDEEDLQTAKVNLAMQGFELINQLVNDFDSNSREAQERAFKLNKAFQLAQAVIEGTRGTLKAYAEAPPGLKIASAALAAAFAAAQIAKISQTKFNSAQFDSKVPNNNQNDLARNVINTPPPNIASQTTLLNQPQQTQVIKAVVVESDITKVQNRVQSIIETASI